MSLKKRFFISYRSTNRPQVERLMQDIVALGHEVWFDKELTGGQAWWDQIMEQIRYCDYVVAALSSDVVKSKPCTEERNYARLLGKPILPVMITSDVIITHFEPELGQIQAINYSNFDDKHAALALARAIDQLPTPVALPVPMPPPPAVPASYLNTLREKIYKRDLSYQEQLAILGELRQSVHEFDGPKEVIPLVEDFLKRPDISVQINTDAQAFLGTLKYQTPEVQKRPPANTLAYEPDIPESTWTQPPKQKQQLTDGWGNGTYYGLLAVSFFIPIIGIVAGIYGMFVGDPSQAKKNQGRNLLILSIVMIIIWNLIFTEMANSFYYYGY